MNTRDFVIENGDRPITVTHFRGEKTERVLVMLHGYMSNRKSDTILSIAEAGTARGVDVLSFDMPEHSDRKSQVATLTVANAVGDFRRVLDYARKSVCKRVMLFGTSLGAYFGLLAALDEECEHLFLKSPALNPPKTLLTLAENLSREIGDVISMRFTMNALSNITHDDAYEEECNDVFRRYAGGVHAPVDIIYGAHDELVTREDVQDFCRLDGDKIHLLVLENEAHRFVTKEAMQSTVNWFTSALER